MTEEQYLKNLECPTGDVDVVLDTDAYNEIDDQFAIAYLLRAKEKLHVRGICAAPFQNKKAATPAEGMQKSYDEIFKILRLMHEEELTACVYRGSEEYLPDEVTPVFSDAARFMATLADSYTPERPLYIVAIGAITNVASALLLNPAMKEKVVVVWLGGHALHWPNTAEFNMRQDIAGARVLFGCGVPLIQLPCKGVVDRFSTSRYELEHWLLGKNDLCDYLVANATREAESYAAGKPWTRVIWDVTAVAWLLDEEGKFLGSKRIPSPIVTYERKYETGEDRHPIRYVTEVKRDALFEDLFRRLGETQ